MLKWIPPVAKAVAAFATALGGGVAAALPDGITAQEWITIAVAVVVATAAVWAVPNRPVTSTE